MIDLELVHQIHTSERKSYRACRRRWDWIFRERFYPFMTAKPLEFGTAFHLAMEKYYDPKTWTFPRETVAEYAITQFVKKCNKQREAFLKQKAVPYLEEDVQADYDERVELGKGMLAYYFKEIAPLQDVGWTPVKVEVAFLVQIPHPDTGETMWCRCVQCAEKWRKHFGLTEDDDWREGQDFDWAWKGLPVCYGGRCDMLAQDKYGDYWIFDWKSAAQVHVDHEEFLELDDQVMSYVWALRKIGLPIRGFVYHEQKKGFPQPPKKNKVRRLGCIYSVAKNQDTDYDTYLKTVSEEDTEAYEAGLYDEFLEYLKNEGIVFYHRFQIHKSDVQCKRAEYDIGQEALEIIDPNTRIYPNPGRFGCTTCAFRQPCLGVNDGSDYQYTLDTLFERREHYYVRTEPSTETKGGE
jgi:hypothetical protein